MNVKKEINLLLDLKTMIGGDLMKATHYLKKSVEVAIVQNKQSEAEELAKFYVELKDFTDRFESSYRKIVD